MSGGRPLRVLLLSEGDAETWDCWSGSCRSLVEHLRADGNVVRCGDVDLRGWDRAFVAWRTVTRTRRRWWVNFHLGADGFRARSRRAQSLMDRHAHEVDAVLQIGATFSLRTPPGIPLALYCDSNIDLAREGMESGFSEASVLTEREAREVRTREAQVYAKTQIIFTMSDRLRATFTGGFGVPESNVVTVHGGPNFTKAQRVAPVQRSPRNAPVILFVGRAFLRKGGDLLLSAFRSVRSAVPDARLLLIGPETLPAQFEADPGIELLGYVDKDSPDGQGRLAAAYARAQVFCLPTRFEPFGVVFLEAMHHGLPCVGPRAWAVPEIIRHGETGLLVRPEDPADLARALIEILQAPAEAARMGEAGRRRLVERFSWALVAARIAARLREDVDRLRPLLGTVQAR